MTYEEQLKQVFSMDNNFFENLFSRVKEVVELKENLRFEESQIEGYGFDPQTKTFTISVDIGEVLVDLDYYEVTIAELDMSNEDILKSTMISPEEDEHVKVLVIDNDGSGYKPATLLANNLISPQAQVPVSYRRRIRPQVSGEIIMHDKRFIREIFDKFDKAEHWELAKTLRNTPQAKDEYYMVELDNLES